MKRKKILLGFSGGIDSCHSAGLLADSGFEVTAVTLDTHGNDGILRDARRKADQLGIPLKIVDVRDIFRKGIIIYFLSEYLAGRTPAPCTLCNSIIKWKTLADMALREGYDNIATGHYFRIARCGGKYYVRKASDPAKDQSYYLWGLSQDILTMAVAPMGEVIKREVKEHLPDGQNTRESMGVCFLEGMRCSDFLRRELADRVQPGEIVNSDGRVVGRHDGTPFYTIGQKKGLEISGPQSKGRCVISIDAERNRLVLGTNDDLFYHELLVSDCNIVDRDELFSADGVTVKIRGFGHNPEKPCTITADGNNVRVRLGDAAWAPAAGQPVVFYRNDRVLGGGILEDYR